MEPSIPSASRPYPDPDQTWQIIRQLADITRGPEFEPEQPLALHQDPAGRLRPISRSETRSCDWRWSPGHGWQRHGWRGAPEVEVLLDLYLPFSGPPAAGGESSRPYVVAHLGQSLDGFIATQSGDSCYVTGRENIRHLHRMRALSDAVLVGTDTAANDNPRLTTRLVTGANPTRVILDRRRRLPAGLRVFTDAAAETLLCCDEALVQAGRERQGCAQVLAVPNSSGRLDLAALLRALVLRGIRRLFIEGGGATISAFFEAGLLNRLQITIAPFLLGTGRPGLRLPAPDRLADVRRPAASVFRMGEDLLYDLDLTGPSPEPAGEDDGVPLERVL